MVSVSNITVSHDETITIALGKSRKDTRWKNTDMLWSDFVKRLSEPHHTAETVRDYHDTKRDRQTEIKDVGGFVGGVLAGGRRKNGCVTNRILLTLDVDKAKDFKVWDDFKLLYGSAGVIYTTHKHTPGQPRYRLCILLDRPAFADEYEAVGRRVADRLGIHNFDQTTFEAARLMFWQSTPKDGQYIFDYIDGAPLSVDNVLDSYTDWRDVSQWAMSGDLERFVKHGMKKQGDPSEKPGLIGAFCRCYDIDAAIAAFLADDYEECPNGRYTYKHGSTTAGLVVYDKVFAYSHHGTDPAGGRLCNAFDLVRVHKFGLRDEDAKEGTPTNKLPSYLAMMDFAAADPETKKLYMKERFAQTQAAFDDDFIPDDTPVSEESDEEDDTDWIAELEVDRKGIVKPTIDNVVKILTHDQALKGKFALDIFAHRVVIKSNLPWRPRDSGNPFYTDMDDAGLRHYIETHYGVASERCINYGLSLTSHRNKFHPIQDYLRSLVWDGVKRVETLLVDYFGAADTVYTRTVTRKALAAACARVFQPGIKFDYVLTLVGAQGLGKTGFFSKLGGKWFSDSFTTFMGKEACEQIQGVWIVEIGELAAMKRSELECVKQFITKQEDIFRKPYGHNTEHYPRQCVFFGTTNTMDFLKDPTGGRRFWPVDAQITKPIKNWASDLTREEISQVWAEALTYYNAGEQLFLPPELETAAFEAQELHSERDEKIGLIQHYLDMEVPENWYKLDVFERRNVVHNRNTDDIVDDYDEDGAANLKTFVRDKICIPEIWCELFERKESELDGWRAKELRNAMLKIDGWEAYDTTKNKGRLRFGAYGIQKAYIRHT